MAPLPSIWPAAILTLISFALALAYLGRVLIHGRARFDRAERVNGSAILSLQMVEMFYWTIQPLVRFCVRFSISPNLLTWLGCGLGAGAGLALAQGKFGIASALSLAAALMDALDGAVAHAGGRVTRQGKFLDSALDRYVEFFLIGGAIYFYRAVDWALIVALLSLLGAFMVSYSTALAEIQNVAIPRGSMRRAERMVLLLLGAAYSPVSIRWLEPSLDLTPGLGIPMIIALGLIGILGNSSAAIRLHAGLQKLREAEANSVPSLDRKVS